MLSHQKLKVYGKSLAVVASLARHSGTWDKCHAVVDQITRASESVVLNIAESARLGSLAQKQQFVDYAVGSALECAACLDIAVAKEFLQPELAAQEKAPLSEVVRMLVGLRRSWEKNTFREEPPDYGQPPQSLQTGWYFAHEPLEVYRVGLSFMHGLNGLLAGPERSNRLVRQIDKAGTSLLLNIAEGYGRTGEADRIRFLETAQGAAVKAAAYLDLAVSKGAVERERSDSGVELLGRVVSMLRVLSRSRSD